MPAPTPEAIPVTATPTAATAATPSTIPIPSVITPEAIPAIPVPG